MSYKTDHAPIKYTKPRDKGDKGYWSAEIVSYSPFSDYHCTMRGLGGTVASAWIEQ